MLIFGLMGLASSFSFVAFGHLAWKRAGKDWAHDVYFWLAIGVTILALGLLEFAVLRTYQTMLLDSVPYVQNATWALTATATIAAGLGCFVRAKSLSNPHLGRCFIAACGLWFAFTFFWTIFQP